MTDSKPHSLKPARLEVIQEKIPEEIRSLPRWLNWSWTWKEKGKKWDKPPLKTNGCAASSTNPATWTTFEGAMRVVANFDGVGFVLGKDIGIVGIDFDDCRDPETGEIFEPAASLIRELDTYSEISPSGNGVKPLCKAILPDPCQKVNHQAGIEVYDGGRYFTITGHHLEGTPATINARQEQVEWLLATFVRKPTAEPTTAPAGQSMPKGNEVRRAREALAALNPARADGYWDWLSIGMSLHAISGDLLGDWDAWSRHSDKHVEGEPARKWKSFSPGKIGPGTLFHLAREDGWVRNGHIAHTGTTSVSSVSAPWGTPEELPSELPSVMPFDDANLPEVVRPFIADVADRMQCPPDYAAVAMMVVLAGLVGRKVGIRPKAQDDWTVVPNLWGLAIGRPGLMKTPAVEEPVRFLKRLEIEAARKYKEELKAYEAAVMVARVKKKGLDDAIKKAIKANGDAHAVALEALSEEPEAPVRRRYMVNDATVEKLGEILSGNPNGVTIVRDEIYSLLRSLDKDGHEAARGFYLEAWNGTGRYTYDRIGRGTLDIEAAIVSMIGSIQPSRLAEYVRSAVRGGSGDDGLIQRFQLAVWPDCPTTWKNVDRWPDTVSKSAVFDAVVRLDGMVAEDIGATIDEGDQIPHLRFDAPALEQFTDWRTDLEHRLRGNDLSPALESHLAKYRSLIPSLALLIHLADGVHGAVTLGPLEKALRWSEYLESHAQRVYSAATRSSLAAARALARKLLDGSLKDGFTLRDVYRPEWSGLTDRDDVVAAIGVLEDLDWLRIEVQQTEGRAKAIHRINPGIFDIPPGKALTKLTEDPSVSSVSVSPGGSAGDPGASGSSVSASLGGSGDRSPSDDSDDDYGEF